MTGSPQCTRCGQDETVEHQLLECANATRMWDLFRITTGSSVRTLYEVLSCSSNLEIETIKSAIIKALVQINRSHNLAIHVIAKSCAMFLRIEATLHPDKDRGFVPLMNELQNVV